MLSNVQNQILSSLIKSNGLRYTEVKPAGVDNDLFNYHLRFLLDKKYIKKDDDFYSLTDFGKKYVLQLGIKGEVFDYFKFSVISVVTRMVSGKKEILMQKRLRHPYYGDTYVGISGKVQLGEEIEDAAKRKLKEETGLECDFKLIGVDRKMRFTQGKKVFEDTLYHICYGENPTGILEKNNDYGLNFWFDIGECDELMNDNVTKNENDKKLLQRLIDKDFSLFYWTEEQILKDF